MSSSKPATDERLPGRRGGAGRKGTHRLMSGDLFVFKNRRGDRLKILAWQGDGFALYLRRLERGTFAFPTSGTAEVSVTATELAMILGGVELQGVQRRTRYTRVTASAEGAGRVEEGLGPLCSRPFPTGFFHIR